MLANETSYLGTLISYISFAMSVVVLAAGFFVSKKTSDSVRDFENQKNELMRKS